MAEPSASQNDASTPELGVLFVHGIGEQLQGQTLVRFGDPLAAWFTRWLTHDEQIEQSQADSSPVALWDTSLVPGESKPASTRMALAYGQPPRRWVLAESWWAQTFRAPKTRTLIVWMLTILPYMLLEQFSVPLRRSVVLRRQGVTSRVFGRLRILVFFLLLVASLPLAGLGLGVLTLLLVPVLIPVKALRQPAERAALKLAQTLGDAFILTSSTVQFDAMVERVATDLKWIAARAERVVVVAHSQGAAVSYEAIRRYGSPPTLEAFVTVGQGLGKLLRVRSLRVRHSNLGYVLAWSAVTAFFLFAIFTVRAVTESFARGSHGIALAVDSLLAAAGFAGVVVAVVFVGRTIRAELFQTPDPLHRATGEVLPWTNLYASADPVPNGPFCDEDTCPAWLDEIEVWNRASVIRDHTAYADVPDDFVACLAERLLRAASPGTVDADLRNRLHRARWQNWWRVWWLAALRLLSLVSACVDTLMVFRNHKLDDIGGRVTWFEHLVGHVVTPFRKALGLGTNLVGDATLTGVVIVAAGVVGAYLILAGVWSMWASAAAHDFFLRPAKGTPPFGGRGFWLFLAALAQTGILAGLIGARGDYPTDWHEVAHGWLPWLIPLPFLVAAAFGLDRWALGPAAWFENRLASLFPVRDSYGD